MRSIFFAVIIAVAIATFVNGGSSGYSEWSYFSSGHAEEPQCQEHAKFNPCGPNPFCYPTCGKEQLTKFTRYKKLFFQEVLEVHLAEKVALLDAFAMKASSSTWLTTNVLILKTAKNDLVMNFIIVLLTDMLEFTMK